MATKGVLMAPIAPLLLIGLLGVVGLYLLVVDQFKVAIFRRFGIH